MSKNRPPSRNNPTPENQPKYFAIRGEVSKSHSGPLPTPEDFGRYEQILPGAAREIMDMAKAQATHRHKMEIASQEYAKDALDLESKRLGLIRIGQIVGGVIALGILGVGACSIFKGQGLQGIALIVSEITALTATFILGGRKKTKKEPPQG